jgi:hypothetical protein
VIKVPPHHPGQPMHGLDYPAPWLYRPFTVLPGYLPLPSPLLINRFAGILYSMYESGNGLKSDYDNFLLYSLRSMVYALIKKKRKFSSYIRKF